MPEPAEAAPKDAMIWMVICSVMLARADAWLTVAPVRLLCSRSVMGLRRVEASTKGESAGGRRKGDTFEPRTMGTDEAMPRQKGASGAAIACGDKDYCSLARLKTKGSARKAKLCQTARSGQQSTQNGPGRWLGGEGKVAIDGMNRNR
jgi:hypothetical protein